MRHDPVRVDAQDGFSAEPASGVPKDARQDQAGGRNQPVKYR